MPAAPAAAQRSGHQVPAIQVAGTSSNATTPRVGNTTAFGRRFSARSTRVSTVAAAANTSSAGRIHERPNRSARAAKVMAVIAAAATRTVRCGIRSSLIDRWVHAVSGHQPRTPPKMAATTTVVTVASGMMCSVAGATGADLPHG
jgi:hypothetical protein